MEPYSSARDVLAKGILKYSNLDQQHRGITTVISGRLHSLFSSKMLTAMKDTVLNRLEIAVDVRSGMQFDPSSDGCGGGVQYILIPLRRLREVVQRVGELEKLADRGGEPSLQLQHVRKELLLASRAQNSSSTLLDGNTSGSRPENQYARLLMIIVVCIPKEGSDALDKSMKMDDVKDVEDGETTTPSTPSRSARSATATITKYTHACMYWMGVISTHDPRLIYAELRKAGQATNSMIHTSASGNTVVGQTTSIGSGIGGTSTHQQYAAIEDYKLVRTDILSRTPIEIQRVFAQWHLWRLQWMGKAELHSSIHTRCSVVSPPPCFKSSASTTCSIEHSDREEGRALRSSSTLANDNNMEEEDSIGEIMDGDTRKVSESNGGMVERTVKPSPSPADNTHVNNGSDSSVSVKSPDESHCTPSIRGNDDSANSSLVAYNSSTLRRTSSCASVDVPASSPPLLYNSSPPQYDCTAPSHVLGVVDPQSSQTGVHCEGRSSPSTSSKNRYVASSPPTAPSVPEDVRMARIVAALLIPPRPLETPTSVVHWARVCCLAAQRVIVLASTYADGVDAMHYDRLHMLLYTTRDVLAQAMKLPSASSLVRETEAESAELQCAGFLVCLAACLLPARARLWYIESETSLSECVYRTLCYTSGMRQHARDCVLELSYTTEADGTHQDQSQNTYAADMQTRWVDIARTRATTTLNMLQSALCIDPQTGQLDETQELCIPQEVETSLIELKNLLMHAYEDHCRNEGVATEDGHGVDVAEEEE